MLTGLFNHFSLFRGVPVTRVPRPRCHSSPTSRDPETEVRPWSTGTTPGVVPRKVRPRPPSPFPTLLGGGVRSDLYLTPSPCGSPVQRIECAKEITGREVTGNDPREDGWIFTCEGELSRNEGFLLGPQDNSNWTFLVSNNPTRVPVIGTLWQFVVPLCPGARVVVLNYRRYGFSNRCKGL